MLPNAALEIFEGKEKIKGMSCQEAMARIMRTVGLVRRPKKDKAKKKTGPKKGKKEREQRQLRRQIFKTHVAIEERRFRQVAIIWTNTVQVTGVQRDNALGNLAFLDTAWVDTHYAL
ncbi:hypothetical protein ADUPG1_005428, partial [Aduncisulcus paluster]